MSHRLESYSYKPLNLIKDEIRLLKLLPAEDHTSQIKGTLFTVSLSDESFPAYNALSYVWGDMNKPNEIWIDDKELRIGRFLNHALRDIRLENDPLVIWIDALCIDQSNIEERCHQVQLMRRIYSNAAVVRSWLDIEVDTSLEPFEALKRCQTIEEIDLNIGDTKFWHPVMRIFSNPYWSRLWVQQEILLATKLIFNFRKTLVDSQHILHFLGAVKHCITDLDSGQEVIAADILNDMFGGSTGHLGGAAFMMNLISLDREGEGFQLLNLYLSTTPLKSHDPRDQLYGLIGILNDFNPDDIEVDYDLEPLEVFAQVPRLLIQAYNSLEFLSYPQATYHSFLPNEKGELFQGAPTWFLIPGHREAFTEHMHYYDRASSGAIGPIGASVQVDRQHGISLHVRGIRIDLVSKTGQHMDIQETPFVEWSQDLRDMISGNSSVENFSLWSRNILNTYIAAWLDNETPRVEHEETLQFYHDFLSLATQKAGKYDLSIHDLHWDEETNDKLQEESIRIPEILPDLFDGRRFFLTTKYGVGLARSCNLQAGDEVWVVFGCPIPLILRKRKPSGYTLVSQCWIEGMMDGEAVVDILDDGHPSNHYSGPSVQDVVLW